MLWKTILFIVARPIGEARCTYREIGVGYVGLFKIYIFFWIGWKAKLVFVVCYCCGVCCLLRHFV